MHLNPGTRWRLLAALSAIGVLAWLLGCERAADRPEATLPGRWYTAGQLEAGRELFRSRCAGCHGLQAQGTADWRRRDAAGNLPPPPLNGSAHAWHHSREQLRDYILDGGAAVGGTMPGFSALLDDRDVLAVIAFFQSTWDETVYTRWASMYPTADGDPG